MTATAPPAHPISDGFSLAETTVSALHAAYLDGRTSCRAVAEWYLRRIEAYDRSGPLLNSIITVAPDVLAQAQTLDDALDENGLIGPLHGVPVLMKDQVDTVGMATALGSVLFHDYVPDRDATVTTRLKAAGAFVLAKTTLGELGGETPMAPCSARLEIRTT